MNNNTKQKVILSLRVIIGILFIFSAVAKLYPIEAFEKQLVDLGFASWTTAPFLSRAIIGVEAFLGISFFQKNYLRTLVVPTTALLLLAFCAHLGYTIYLTGGSSGNCGCFGQLLPMTPIEALLKNIVTLGLLGYLYTLTKNYEGKKIILPVALLVGTFGILFFAFPVKTYVTDFKEMETLVQDSSILYSKVHVENDTTLSTYKIQVISDTTIIKSKEVDTKKQNHKTAVSDTIKKANLVKTKTTYTPKSSIYASFKNYSDGITANVDKGTSIVALLSLECEHCMETALRIGELNKKEKLPPVYYLFFGNQGQIDQFFDVAKYRFPYKIIEPQLFFPLLGDNPAPPRVSVLKEGNIVGDFNFETFSTEKLKKAIE